MNLTAAERQLLRQRVDRALRERIGGPYASKEEWCSFADAAGVIGLRASELRRRARERGLPTKKQAGRTLVRIEDLDRLR